MCIFSFYWFFFYVLLFPCIVVFTFRQCCGFLIRLPICIFLNFILFLVWAFCRVNIKIGDQNILRYFIYGRFHKGKIQSKKDCWDSRNLLCHEIPLSCILLLVVVVVVVVVYTFGDCCGFFICLPNMCVLVFIFMFLNNCILFVSYVRFMPVEILR